MESQNKLGAFSSGFGLFWMLFSAKGAASHSPYKLCVRNCRSRHLSPVQTGPARYDLLVAFQLTFAGCFSAVYLRHRDKQT